MRTVLVVLVCASGCASGFSPDVCCTDVPSFRVGKNTHIIAQDYDTITVHFGDLVAGCSEAVVTDVAVSAARVHDDGFDRAAVCRVMDCDGLLSIWFGTVEAPLTTTDTNSDGTIDQLTFHASPTDGVHIPATDTARTMIPPLLRRDAQPGRYVFIIDGLVLTDVEGATTVHLRNIVSPEFGIDPL